MIVLVGRLYCTRALGKPHYSRTGRVEHRYLGTRRKKEKKQNMIMICDSLCILVNVGYRIAL